ncbi:uncharacterized protein LOC107026686 isoform X1 [Solanum pennellii]|uniref:Uncharacterized protein LOC107026686 isoform X1 n=1 Tax=Solanum pennellii TaxID=28526 RepID=A0ABM1HBR5_SOLPN|nr:uncharacterized protein LOC107026686 isoform X1 [Solanum pennellii]
MDLTRVREVSVPVIPAFACEKDSEAMRRRRVLRKFDKELANRNYKAANSLLKQLQHKPRALLCFDSAKLVPKIINTQELSMVDSSSFESLVDTIMCSIKYSIKFALSDEEVLITGFEDATGSETDNSPYEDHQMCLQHEVGHFLVGYLVGVLPRSYEVPSLQDVTQDKFAQGNVQFLGFEFLKEVDINTISSKRFTHGKLKSKENRAKISSQTLNRFLCVILGGLAAEHLLFGYSELLHSDVQKLDRVLRWLCYNENEADSLVRWAILTTLSLLSHHHEARSRLAEAMTSRRSIGYCIDMIESTL